MRIFFLTEGRVRVHVLSLKTVTEEGGHG